MHKWLNIKTGDQPACREQLKKWNLLYKLYFKRLTGTDAFLVAVR